MKRLVPLPLLFLCIATAAAREFSVLTYNVENLFDADKVAIFDEYAETGSPDAYNPAKALRKIQNIASVLKTFNNGAGPEVVCFNEIEIDFTPDSSASDHAAFLEKYRGTTVDKMLTTELNDEIRGVPAEALLLKYLEDNGMTGYRVVVGADKPDLAAVGSEDRETHRKAQKSAVFTKFPVLETRSHPTPDARDILEVKLDVDGHPLTVFVNHWKSRASDLAAENSRRFNAKTLRDRLEQIFAENPSADVLLAGDFNSHYNQTQAFPHLGRTAVNDVLGSQGDELKTALAKDLSIYNLWYELPRKERYSDEFKGVWGTLMQKMVTPGLYDQNGVQYVDNSFSVVRLDGINRHTELGLPHRWSNAGEGSGTSDHFPIVARFRTVEDADPSARIAPEKPGKEDATDEPLRVGYEKLSPGRVPALTSQVAKSADEHVGELFRVAAMVTSRRPLAVEAFGSEFLLWSPDEDLLKRMRGFAKGDKVEFLGELGLHKGKWQFVVHSPQWLLKVPAPVSD